MTDQDTETKLLASALAPYVAWDRREAGRLTDKTPDQSSGAALFADISGSTALAEALVNELGRRRGAEEVTRQLNLVYEALIRTLHRYGGSVIGFSGDAITCWFSGDDGWLAISCAQSMQKDMQSFRRVETPAGSTVDLAIKVAVTVGAASRFVVGDPEIQVFDVLAGSVLDELAVAEHQAGRGEIILPYSLAEQFEGRIQILAERIDAQSGMRFALIKVLELSDLDIGIADEDQRDLRAHELKPWVQADVYTRLKSGQGDFLAELRPAVALFLRFSGLMFDTQPDAPKRLDDYIQAVQKIVKRFDGNLIQLTMGDKGSYAYVAFGAPIAHEDDVDRAIAAALEIQETSEEIVGAVQIGISHGLMRTGAYGSSRRRTYGVLGDEVNVAARLMQAAEPGQILVTEAAVKRSERPFDWQAMPEVQAKGKQGLIRVFQPMRGEKRSMETTGSRYTLPIVGRQAELESVRSILPAVAERQGCVIGVTAPAGMGKTRLAYEMVEIARETGFEVSSSECPSYGTQSSYLVWRSIWRSLLGVEDVRESSEMIARLERIIDDTDPGLTKRLPLLSPVLNLSIEDNELTSGFTAKIRKSSLEALLISLLKAHVEVQPLLIFLDDVQWIDPLSADLLSALSRASVDLPVLILLTYRDEDPGISESLGLTELRHFTEINLSEFGADETRTLLELKVRQLYGEGMSLPAEVINQIAEKAQGNPFYVEELLNYLKDRGLDPRDKHALEQVALPSSLASLILSRIDQLDENQKVTLRLASVIGRFFREEWLTEAFAESLPPDQIRRDLDELNRLELTQFDKPEPELTYLFKHIITHEVAYDSLPFAKRATLHEQLGRHIEAAYEQTLDQYLDFLAHHYGMSANDEKKKRYLLQAGRAAQERYANEAAINYYKSVLNLLASGESVEVLGDLANTLELIGEWDEAQDMYLKAVREAEASGRLKEQARFQAELGEFFRKQGHYDEAIHWWDLATKTFSRIDDQAGIGQVIHYQGTLAAQQGEYAKAQQRYELSLAIRKELADRENIANLYNNMGVVARMEGNYERSLAYQEKALELRREQDDPRLIAISLNNLGNLTVDRGDLQQARNYLEESLILQRQVGDRWAIANCLNNLANVARAQGDFHDAAHMYKESLLTNRDLGDLWAIAYLLEDIAGWAGLEAKPGAAVRLAAAADALRDQIGAPRSGPEQEKLDQALEKSRAMLSDDEILEESDAGSELSMEAAIRDALEVLEHAHEDESLRSAHQEIGIKVNH